MFITTLSFLFLAAMPNADFITQMETGVNQYRAHNQAVVLFGHGTATLRDTGRKSKVGCQSTNPNPKPGECSGLEPVWPERHSLDEVVKVEAATQVKAKTTSTAWVAWIDEDGIINVAFNAPIAQYELSTIWEVANNGDWQGWDIWNVSTPKGQDAPKWVQSKTADFGWLKLGKGGRQDLPNRLKSLQDLKVIEDYKIE